MRFAPVIAALAAGFKEGGCRFSFNYPGFHANELHDALGGGNTSINERTAMAMGWGASLAGVRGVVSFKNVGLNDAADPYLHANLLGCHGGLVVGVFEDCDIEHSQNRQDSRPYFDMFGGLWIEPRSVRDAYETARDAFDLSERLGTPITLRITNVAYAWRKHIKLESRERLGKNRPFLRDPARWVAHPSHAAKQETELHKRRAAIACYVTERFCGDALSGWRSGGVYKRIIFGARREVNREKAIRINTLPLPENILRDILATQPDLAVHENGQPYVANLLRSLTGRCQPSYLMNNRRLRFQHHNRQAYEPLFGRLRMPGKRIIIGDLGEYTMDPWHTLDACLCYGASVAVAMGCLLYFQKDGRTPPGSVIAVTGDAAFAHSGALAFDEAVCRNLPVKVIVFDNGGSRGTGGQSIPGGIRRVEGWHNVRHFDMASMDSLDDLMEILLANNSGPALCIVKTKGE